MQISELIEELQSAQAKHGDLSIQVVCHAWQESHLPPSVMGGGGAGWSTEWCGTIAEIQISGKHPDQLELIITI